MRKQYILEAADLLIKEARNASVRNAASNLSFQNDSTGV